MPLHPEFPELWTSTQRTPSSHKQKMHPFNSVWDMINIEKHYTAHKETSNSFLFMVPLPPVSNTDIFTANASRQSSEMQTVVFKSLALIVRGFLLFFNPEFSNQ